MCQCQDYGPGSTCKSVDGSLPLLLWLRTRGATPSVKPAATAFGEVPVWAHAGLGLGTALAMEYFVTKRSRPLHLLLKKNQQQPQYKSHGFQFSGQQCTNCNTSQSSRFPKLRTARHTPGTTGKAFSEGPLTPTRTSCRFPPSHSWPHSLPAPSSSLRRVCTMHLPPNPPSLFLPPSPRCPPSCPPSPPHGVLGQASRGLERTVEGMGPWEGIRVQQGSKSGTAPRTQGHTWLAPLGPLLLPPPLVIPLVAAAAAAAAAIAATTVAAAIAATAAAAAAAAAAAIVAFAIRTMPSCKTEPLVQTYERSTKYT